MKRIRVSGILSKIITGDNIYIAIETAQRAGIISPNEKIIIIEGENQKKDNVQSKLIGTWLHKDKKEEIIEIPYSEYLNSSQYTFAVDGTFIDLDYALSKKIKVFSRIKPEGKSEIVKRYQKLFKEEY